MKNKKLMLGTAMVALSAMAARAAIASTATVNVQAQVVTAAAIVVNTSQDLDFGTFTVGLAGSVALDVTGVPGYGGGVTATPSTTPAQAIIKIKAVPASNVVITVTDPTIQISNGTTTMNVSQFDVNTNGAGPTNTLNMGATSTIAVPIGATLAVGAGQAGGTYTGTFKVSVNY